MALATQIIKHLRALFGVVDDGPGGTFDVEAEIKRAFEGHQHVVLADADACTDITKTHVYFADKDITVTACKFVSDGAKAVNATNYAVIQLYAGNGTAAAATSVAVGNLATGTNLAAGTPYALTLSSTAANLDVDAGETLAVEVAKNGAGGFDLPAGSLVFHYRYR